MEDTGLILQYIKEHRDAAMRFNQYCADATDPESENIKEIRKQAEDCEHIANWLEELLTLRRVLECQFLNKDG